jgi:predicted phosphodiesterase
MKKLTKILVTLLFIFLSCAGDDDDLYWKNKNSDFLLKSNQELEDSELNVWIFSDPHVDPSSRYKPIAEALADAKTFPWDIAVVPGDWISSQRCPTDRHGREIIRQFGDTDLRKIYTVIGNHDADPNYAWFLKWLNPIQDKIYPVTGEWDHYSFKIGKVLFLVLGDRNAPGEPFGRVCNKKGGYPAGGYSLETYDWWVAQLEDPKNKKFTIVTIAHHGLIDTTAYTGYGEGRSKHGEYALEDKVGSSFIYGIGDLGIEERNFGFRQYIDDHPGSVDFWIHGHTHKGFYPGIEDPWGKADVMLVGETTFINAGSVGKNHAEPEVPYSYLMQFKKKEVILTPYLHEPWGHIHDAGFYKYAQVVVTLENEKKKD